MLTSCYAVLRLVVVGLIVFAAAVAAQEPAKRDFATVFRERLAAENKLQPKDNASVEQQIQAICPYESTQAIRTIILKYGSMFAATRALKAPDRCIFYDEADVARFQRELSRETATLGSVTVELQKEASKELIAARVEAVAAGRDITPLDGAIAAGRSYADTLRIWLSRFDPALAYWTAKGKIKPEEAAAVRKMNIFQLIDQVSAWEKKGMLFGTNRGGSIFSSVAPPGTSQHLSLLAFDVVEHGDPVVRTILNRHGWYQTIRSDTPHFTYLGLAEAELKDRGLKKKLEGGRVFWLPDADDNDLRSRGGH
jgi:hypothetical protein